MDHYIGPILSMISKNQMEHAQFKLSSVLININVSINLCIIPKKLMLFFCQNTSHIVKFAIYNYEIQNCNLKIGSFPNLFAFRLI